MSGITVQRLKLEEFAIRLWLCSVQVLALWMTRDVWSFLWALKCIMMLTNRLVTITKELKLYLGLSRTGFPAGGSCLLAYYI